MSRRLRISALAGAAALLTAGCGIAGRALQDRAANPGGVRSTQADTRDGCDPQPAAVLTGEELVWAQTAWRYVEANRNAATGLINSTDKRPLATMWDAADAIASLVAARELGLIDRCGFDARFGTLAGFLNTMPLVDNIAPNRWYDAAKGVMVDPAGRPAVTGWSASDLGRLLLWLRIVDTRYPEWSPYIGRAVARWNYCAIVDACGTLRRGVHEGADINRIEQEGRLGYEEYAAAGFALWNFDTAKAAEIAPARPIEIDGIALLEDARAPAAGAARASLTTTPFAAYEMEIGGALTGDDAARYRELGRALARVQYARQERHGVMTARGARPLVSAPWLIFDSVWAEGYSWNPIDQAGQSSPHLALLSTASVFEMWAAYPDPAAARMLDFLCALRDDQRGFYAGRYERTGAVDTTLALRTNAAVLESLLYRRRGVMHRAPTRPSWLELQARDEFFRPGRCLPGERRTCGEECEPFGLRVRKAPQDKTRP